jgi:hypothetical protein
MKCPYNRKSLKWVKQYTNDLINEETGVVKSNNEVLIETYELADCLQSECGAWHDDRCQYMGCCG